MSMKFIILFLTILLGSFLEIIVFNEEVLLALCFISFTLFAYNQLGSTISDIFADRASKFEADLIVVFEAKYNSLTELANDSLMFFKLSGSLALIESSQIYSLLSVTESTKY